MPDDKVARNAPVPKPAKTRPEPHPSQPNEVHQNAPVAQPAKSRPEPPPFRPNKDLIGYVEKGQKPPVRRASPSEKR